MHLVVLGGGVISVTTAYYLAESGHEVTLIDRQKGPALETSYANAGEISPGYAAPWAGPGVPLKVIKWMLQPHSPLVIRLRLDPAMLRRLVRMLFNPGDETGDCYKGDRIRAAGTAELNGFNLDSPRSRCDTILHVVDDLFPGGGDTTDVKLWTGLRPMNPDGTPTIGPTRYPNLFVNTGHGTLGWTMACGSGRVVADLVSNRKPEIDIDGLTLARYG